MRGLALICVLAARLALPVEAAAQGVGGVNLINPEGRVFTSDLDGICGIGQVVDQGCDAIRAREIVDATAAPWRGIGRVNFASMQVRQHCTGTLIADRIVLTAAHCLFVEDRKLWLPAESVQFVAGYQRGEGRAVSAVTRYVLSPMQDQTSREMRGGPIHDWALLLLADPLGQTLGQMQIATGPEVGQVPQLAGYPSLRAHVLSVAHDCGLPGEIADGRLMVTTCAAMSGDSGAPLVLRDDAGARVIGVLSSVVGTPDGVFTLSIPVASWHDAFTTLQAE